MAGSMHMPVGTRFCCGMIEMYPKGEFTPIKGHGYDYKYLFAATYSIIFAKNFH